MIKFPTLAQHLKPGGPKRILALDGGGVRGILSLAYLQKVEALLQARCGNNPQFRLCHYFDMIGGTSTGAIIAAGLAVGLSVEELSRSYHKLAASVFKKPWYRFGIFDAKFQTRPLQEALESVFGDVTLGSDRILTGLVIMAKRLDTGSPWVIHNHPAGRYYEPGAGSTGFPNRLYKLRQVVRASTAAPHYFEPERIQVADGVAGAFIDGGVSPHNDPALQCFMVGTLKGYGWAWATGADNLLLISVGTGQSELRLNTDQVIGSPAIDLTRRALLSLMDDCSTLGQTLLQWMSRCPTRRQIDSEIGDLRNDQLGGQELLTYVRYNLRFESAWIARNLGTEFDEQLLSGLKPMDAARNVTELERLGQLAATKQVLEEHFPSEFDLRD